MAVIQPPGVPSRYQVTAKLGAGGMGIVYKARDTSLEKDVAIKMLLIPNLEPSVLARFHREAKLASSLKHANLITVLDFGVTSDGNPYMVMDYVDGETLAAKVEREGPQPLDQSLEIFIQICQGLSHAHNKGIIHRDLKPGNIILTTGDTGGLIVKVLDFGLAKPTGAINESTLTEFGAIVGSPLYMSPEQAQSVEIDHRTDIYSLGCLMYKVLTGNVPFEGASALETLAAKSQQIAPRLAVSSHEDTAAFPENLCDIVARCLSIEPSERYQSMNELSAALVDLLAELAMSREQLIASSAPSDPAVETPAPDVPSYKVPTKVVGLVVIVSTVLCGLFAILIFQDGSQPLVVPKPTKLEPVNKGFATAYDDFGVGNQGVNYTRIKIHKLIGVSESDDSTVKIQKLENYLNSKSGDFNWSVCDELRELHLKRNPKKSMEYCDLMLKNSIMNEYLLNVLTNDWVQGDDEREIEQSIVKLNSHCSTYPGLKYLVSACTLKVGDFQRRLKRPELAKSYYLKIASLTDKDLSRYRAKAEDRLMRLEKGLEVKDEETF